MNQLSSSLRMPVRVAIVLAVLFSAYYIGDYAGFFRNMSSDRGTDDPATEESRRQEKALKESYTTVVQIHDSVFIPNAVVVRPDEEIAFFTADLRIYDVVIKNNKLFSVQGLVNSVTKVSTFLFSREGVYVLEIKNSNDLKKGTLTVTVMPQ